MRGTRPTFCRASPGCQRQQIGQVRKARPDQRFAVENLLDTRLVENFRFARLHHFHFSPVILVGRAFIDAQLENARALRGGRLGQDKVRPFFKRLQEGAVHAVERGLFGGSSQKAAPAFTYSSSLPSRVSTVASASADTPGIST